MQETTFCSKCQQYKPASEFRSKSGDAIYYSCADCRRSYSRQWMRNRVTITHSEIWVILKTAMGSSCVRCGFSEFPEALECCPVRNLGSGLLADAVNKFAYGSSQQGWDELIAKANDHILLCPTCSKALRANLWRLEDLAGLKIGLLEAPQNPLLEHG